MTSLPVWFIFGYDIDIDEIYLRDYFRDDISDGFGGNPVQSFEHFGPPSLQLGGQAPHILPDGRGHEYYMLTKFDGRS